MTEKMNATFTATVEDRPPVRYTASRESVWREWFPATNTFGRNAFVREWETGTFITFNIIDEVGTREGPKTRKFEPYARVRAVPPYPDWEQVAFEERSRTREWVARYNAGGRTNEFLRTCPVRVFVKVLAPVINHLITRKLITRFEWRPRVILYYGAKTTFEQNILGDGIVPHTRLVWDIDQTDETPTAHPIATPDDRRSFPVAFVPSFLSTYAQRSVGKLKAWHDAWCAEIDRVGEARGATERAHKQVEDYARKSLEWRSVLYQVREEHQRETNADTGEVLRANNIVPVGTQLVSPIIDLATFAKKAKSVRVAEMPDAFVPHTPVLHDLIEAERDKRVELKRSLVEKVFHPERANRVAEMYGLTMDEWMERV